LADTKITDLTEKATGAATDEFVINDVAGGNADKKLGMDGIRITESQITDLQTYLTDITGEVSTSLSDTANIAYQDTANTFTATQTAQSENPASTGFISTVYGSNSGFGSFFVGRGTQGTIASPTATVDDDILARYIGQGWDGTSAFPNSANVTITADGNFTATSSPGRITLATTPALSTTPVERLRISQDGAFDFKSGAVTNLTIVEDGTGNAIKITRYMTMIPISFTASTATGDGQFYAHIPPQMDGYNLTYVHAEVITAGTTGTTDIQIHNVDNALDMLSTKLTIDTTETGSDTAATAAVINTSNDHVNTNDVIRLDIDAVSTTPAKGLLVTLGFREP